MLDCQQGRPTPSTSLDLGCDLFLGLKWGLLFIVTHCALKHLAMDSCYEIGAPCSVDAIPLCNVNVISTEGSSIIGALDGEIGCSLARSDPMIVTSPKMQALGAPMGKHVSMLLKVSMLSHLIAPRHPHQRLQGT